MDRRDFLHPRQLARTTGNVLSALDELAPEVEEAAPSSEDLALVRLRQPAMATTFEALIPFGMPNVSEVGEVAFELLEALEEQLSVYRHASEVSWLNRLAGQRNVPVERGLFDLLCRAARLTEETGGAFDISAGALVKVWGFFRGPRRVPSEIELREVLTRVGMQHVNLMPESQSVRYLRPGLEINLGSIGKGYALERMAEVLFEQAKIQAGLLHGGHSSVYAKGCPPGKKGWLVGLTHPENQNRLARVWLRDRSLGTSSSAFRHLEFQGRKLGHVLDPRSGWPAEGILSATAVTSSPTEADALATAFYILGVEGTRAYCEAHPNVGAILLPEDPDARPMVFNLGSDEIELEGAGG